MQQITFYKILLKDVAFLSVCFLSFILQCFYNMAKGKPTSSDIRNSIITLSLRGENQSSIARRLLIQKSTVSRILRQYRRTGNVLPQKKTGRRRKTTPRQDKRILRLSQNNPFMSSNQILANINKAGPSGLSDRLIRRRLV